MKFKNQLEMFNYIWETREHISELSKKPLFSKIHPRWHFQFAHVLNKGSYTKYRLNPDNIMLMTPEEHQDQESSIVFQQRKVKLKKQYFEENKLTNFRDIK